MSFYDVMADYRAFDFESFFAGVTDADVSRILSKPRLSAPDFLALLSPAAEPRLEDMARRARQLTIQHFGRTMQLFTPIYVSDHCINGCVYCGFNTGNHTKRTKLSLDEVRKEAEIIAATGLQHVLLLTGEHPKLNSVEYIGECCEVLEEYFSCIGIEVYPLNVEDYAYLAGKGVDGMTMFQEVYDEESYGPLHPTGPKHNYRYRLECPERACRAGLRTVNVGALLGLHDWRSEAFFTGLHADYLQTSFPDVEVSLSAPRMRPHLGGFPPKVHVTDKNLVQYITAFRLFMPRAGITVSSRENPEMREHLLMLGVTRMSAGSNTAVGGRSHADQTGQFDISDDRSVEAFSSMLYAKGYQPIFKDWQAL